MTDLEGDIVALLAAPRRGFEHRMQCETDRELYAAIGAASAEIDVALESLQAAGIIRWLRGVTGDVYLIQPEDL